MRSKIVMVAGVIALVVAAGAGFGYWAAHSGASVPSAPPIVPVSSPNSAGNQGSSGSPDVRSVAMQNSQPTPVTPQPIIPVQTNPVAQVSTNPSANTNWEDSVDDIVGSDDPDTNKVSRLFALFPTLPPDGQEEVVQHLSNLVEDTNYAQLGELLTNGSLPQGVLDELMSDVLNRPNSLKLPMLLTVGQDPSNPEHDEAKDLLELYLGEDPSTNNWAGAGDLVNNWLKQNPD